MTSLSGYQRELSLPLISGIHEDPPWTTFMQRLVEQTYARRAVLVITLSNAMSSQPPAVVHVKARRAAHEPSIDFQRISAMGLIPFGIMRPGRVYALDEMLDYGDAARCDQQRDALKGMGVRYGRWLRIASVGFADAWVLLVREQDDFSAFASSLLSSLVPHFAAALQVFAALSAQRLSSKMANRALEKVGVGQIAFDGTGRVIAADALSEAHLSFLPEPGPASGRRLQLRPAVAREMETACMELARGAGALRRLVYLGAQLDLYMVLRPSDLISGEFEPHPSVIGTIRIGVQKIPGFAVEILSALYGLSNNEASLAYGLANGESIADAGRRLHLTAETARVYSKRIYAKTGSVGQVDLVRKIMASLVPFA